MAKLEFVDHGIHLDTHAGISHFLNSEGIQFGTFDLNDRARTFAGQSRLSEEDRQVLLQDYRHITKLYEDKPKFHQDIIFLHPGFEHYAFLVHKFGALHFHYENEYWYMFGGMGHFGYLSLQGLRFLVHLFPGEYISVPEGRWQWWASNVEEEFKAMRFFNSQGLFAMPDVTAICQEALQQNAATTYCSSDIESI